MSNIHSILAPAKINLRLKIEGLRSDGYHLLSMLNVVSCDLADRIDIAIKSKPEITLELTSPNPDPDLSDPQRNLASRAAHLFCQRFGVKAGLHLKLTKNIPSGAGLAGGSSDGAAVLRMLTDIFSEYLVGVDTKEEVEKIALTLGADLPYLYDPAFAWVTGIGEKIQILPSQLVEGLTLLVIVPEIPVPTAEIFRISREQGVDSRPDAAASQFVGQPTAELLVSLIENDLQSIVHKQYPEIRRVIGQAQDVTGLQFTMSGSGGSHFALVEREAGKIALDTVQNKLKLPAYLLRISNLL